MAIPNLLSIKRTAGLTVENGALTSLYAAASPEALTLGGKVCYSQPSAHMVNLIYFFQYLVPYAEVADPTPQARNAELAKTLWDWCEDELKGH